MTTIADLNNYIIESEHHHPTFSNGCKTTAKVTWIITTALLAVGTVLLSVFAFQGMYSLGSYKVFILTVGGGLTLVAGAIAVHSIFKRRTNDNQQLNQSPQKTTDDLLGAVLKNSPKSLINDASQTHFQRLKVSFSTQPLLGCKANLSKQDRQLVNLLPPHLRDKYKSDEFTEEEKPQILQLLLQAAKSTYEEVILNPNSKIPGTHFRDYINYLSCHSQAIKLFYCFSPEWDDKVLPVDFIILYLKESDLASTKFQKKFINQWNSEQQRDGVFVYYLECSEIHQSLFLIDTKNKAVEFWDSMSNLFGYSQGIEQGLKNIANGLKYKFSNRTEKTKLQNDTYNCVSWACYFAERKKAARANKKPINVSSLAGFDIDNWREKTLLPKVAEFYFFYELGTMRLGKKLGLNKGLTNACEQQILNGSKDNLVNYSMLHAKFNRLKYCLGRDNRISKDTSEIFNSLRMHAKAY